MQWLHWLSLGSQASSGWFSGSRDNESLEYSAVPQVPLGCAGVIWEIRDIKGEYRLFSSLGGALCGLPRKVWKKS